MILYLHIARRPRIAREDAGDSRTYVRPKGPGRAAEAEGPRRAHCAARRNRPIPRGPRARDADTSLAMSERSGGSFALPRGKRASIPARSTDVGVGEVIALETVPGLVEQAQQGDRDAFGQLYRLYRPQVFRMARFHLGTDADDVVAEVFLRAWTSLPRYRDTGRPFIAWLYGIARHVVSDEIKRRVRTSPSDQLPEEPTHWREDDRLALAAAVAALPDEQRRVIEMKFLMGMRNPEIAAILAITPGAVNARQWRAFVALRGLLREDG